MVWNSGSWPLKSAISARTRGDVKSRNLAATVVRGRDIVVRLPMAASETAHNCPTASMVACVNSRGIIGRRKRISCVDVSKEPRVVSSVSSICIRPQTAGVSTTFHFVTYVLAKVLIRYWFVMLVILDEPSKLLACMILCLGSPTHFFKPGFRIFSHISN